MTLRGIEGGGIGLSENREPRLALGREDFLNAWESRACLGGGAADVEPPGGPAGFLGEYPFMTALAGFLARSGGNVSSACAAMLKAQSVYGHESAVYAVGPIAMGRRLFRSLPEDAYDRAPASGGEGNLLLVADIRLDNRDELAASLGEPAGRFCRTSDSALLLRVWERWEEETLDRIVGDFAFALWDERRSQLVLARDYSGQRPLHYHRGEGFFAFASMPKGLHALPDIPYSPDLTAMAEFLALVPETGPRSFFEGVHKVEPGNILTVTRDSVSTRKYWRPPSGYLQLRDPREYEEGVREKLDNAVSACLRGAGDFVGTQLSGGLDSSAVSATAARLLAPSGGKVLAFTSIPRPGYPDPGFRSHFVDEGPRAAEVAARYENMEHLCLSVDSGSPLEGLDRYFFLYERPVLNLCNGVWYHAINDLARQRGVTVLLNARTGNMSLSYLGLEALPDLLARGHWLRLWRTASALTRNGMSWRNLVRQSVVPFIPQSLWDWINRWRPDRVQLGDYSLLHPSLLESSELRRAAADREVHFDFRPRRGSVAVRMFMIEQSDMGNYNKGALAGSGVDHRDPTADRRLMEFCLSIPPEEYLAGGQLRSVARRALSDRLPATLLRETRTGYQAADWHEGLTAARSELDGEISRIAAMSATAGLLDTRKLQQLISTWPSGGWNRPQTINRYRYGLLRAVSSGHFVRKVVGSN